MTSLSAERKVQAQLKSANAPIGDKGVGVPIVCTSTTIRGENGSGCVQKSREQVSTLSTVGVTILINMPSRGP